MKEGISILSSGNQMGKEEHYKETVGYHSIYTQREKSTQLGRNYVSCCHKYKDTIGTEDLSKL